MKICTKCKETKPLDRFSYCKTNKGPNSWCKPCINRAKSEWLRKKTLRERTAILGEPVKCAICECGFDFETKGKGSNADRPQFDHDHETGLARGWLCFDCNVGLGKFRDNQALLLKAAEYVGQSCKGKISPVESKHYGNQEDYPEEA